MAGYSYEEAREYIFDKKKSSCFNEKSLVENFWSEVGFPKGTRCGKMNACRWEGSQNTDNVLRRNLLHLKVQSIFHHRLREGLHRILIFERKAS